MLTRLHVTAITCSQSSLIIRRTRLSTVGDRTFPVVADRLCLEQSATARHVGIITVCLQSAQDVQTLLSVTVSTTAVPTA